MKQMKVLLVFGVMAVMVGACSLSSFFSTSPDSEPGGSEVEGSVSVGEVLTFTGNVVGGRDDCMFDGICSLYVESTSEDVTGQYEVIYAPGMLRCEGSYDGSADVGDTVEVYGESTEPGVISICALPDYYIQKQ